MLGGTDHRQKFGIGQRAILIRTGEGNILWDCIAYLDSDTVEKVRFLSFHIPLKKRELACVPLICHTFRN